MLGAIFAMVLIILATSATTYFITVDRLQGGPGAGSTTVMTAAPVVDRGDIAGTSWNAMITVNAVLPIQARILHDDLWIRIESPGGSPLLQSWTPSLFTQFVGQDTSAGDPRVWIDDTVEPYGQLSVGDSIVVTGMSLAFEGAIIEMTVADHMVGYASLPTDFVFFSKTTLLLGNPNTQQVNRGGGRVYDASVSIVDITPHGRRILWDELRISMGIYPCGGIAVNQTQLKPDDPAHYDVIASIGFEAWYIETKTTDVYMSIGDSIKVTGIGGEVLANVIYIVYKGQTIGRSDLPIGIL